MSFVVTLPQGSMNGSGLPFNLVSSSYCFRFFSLGFAPYASSAQFMRFEEKLPRLLYVVSI